MNKKFTFMVAALLAAGSMFAANVSQVKLSKLTNGGVYYIVSDVNTPNSNAVSANDVVLGVNSSSNLAASTTSLSGIDETDFEDFKANHMWKVTITDGNYTFTNIATGKNLAVGDATANKNGTITYLKTDAEIEQAKENGAYYEKFQATSISTNGDAAVFTVAGLNSNANKLSVAASNSVTVAASAAELMFVNTVNVDATAKVLQDAFGNNIALAFKDAPAGAEKFANVSVVGVGNTSSENFYLMVSGEVPATGYFANTTSDEFKEAEFVVLTNTKALTSAANGVGYAYDIVKGKDLLASVTSGTTKVESGKYPLQNAQFSAVTNASKAGQVSLSQASVYYQDASGKWANLSTGVTVGVSGTAGSATVCSQASTATKVWLTVSKGTVVSVKDLVNGKMIVNVITTEAGKESFICALGLNGTTSKVYEGRDEANKILPTLSSQWYVSANHDNTVTLINRDNNSVRINNVTLHNAGTNVYSITGNTVFANRLVRFDAVETTEFDGFLKLDKQALKSKYVLSTTDYNVGLTGVDVYWAQNKQTTSITAATETDADNTILEWNIATVMKTSDKEAIDTAYVETSYNYYDGDALKTAKDKLAAFKYTLTAANAKGANTTLASAYKLGTSAQKVVFKKVADNKYAMYYAPTTGLTVSSVAKVNSSNVLTNSTSSTNDVNFTLVPVEEAPSFNPNGKHFALELNGSYLGANAELNGITTNDTTLLKSTNVDSSFSFFAFSADKEEELTPNYFLSTNGKMMYNPADSISYYEKAISEVGLDEELKDNLKAELAKYGYVSVNGETVVTPRVKFQSAKYAEAEKAVVVAGDTVSKEENLNLFKFNLLENENGTVSVKAEDGKYVSVVNSVAVLSSGNKAEFTVVAAEAPTSNEGVSASEVAVVAQNGSVVVKNAAGKNVVVSTILGQVVANEVLTSDNATINVPAGIVVVAVEGESFKVNVK